MRQPLRTLIAPLLALSLLGGWTVQAATSCGGACCGAEASALQPLQHDRPMVALLSSGCGCCAAEAPPCDLERAPTPEIPPRVLSTAPKVEAPAAGLLAVHSPLATPESLPAGLRRCGTDPPDRAAPTPLYLSHLAFLC